MSENPNKLSLHFFQLDMATFSVLVKRKAGSGDEIVADSQKVSIIFSTNESDFCPRKKYNIVPQA